MMFAKYVYNGGATAANITIDIVKILTGETNLANLSAQCNTAKSYITSTIAAGWSVHDASAGTNAQCLKAATYDGLGYKYATISNDGTLLYMKVYGYWNAATHAGSYLSYSSDISNYCQKVDLTNGGIVWIGSSARFIFMLSHLPATNTWGSSTGASPMALLEYTKIMPWYDNASFKGTFGFTSFFTGLIYPGQTKRRTNGMWEISGSYSLQVMGMFGNPASQIGTTYQDFVFDGTNLTFSMGPLYVYGNPNGGDTISGYHGDITSLADIWAIQGSTGCIEDTFTYNGNTYIMMPVTSGNYVASLALRKG
ncbi:MAG: hypothetical protein HQL77_13835 [Magnetococcales bacterium]|nr:hypothetical protein [Magnetococcales bacterium]